ncbi:MAG: type III pantothenate kinase [Firmicutes bacterium]|nr:type III pantothenate kinase [Bacillota bacterium]
MLLAVDVGNTHTTLGVFRGEALVHSWRIVTEPSRTADEYGLLITSLMEHAGLDPRGLRGVAICSVVPPVTPTLERMCQEYFGLEPLTVGPGVKTGLVIRYDNPREVGADRVVLALAAYTRYGGPTIVVDFSYTATIFDYISRAGEYLGGVIAPGVSTAADALFQHAAKLPRIELARPRSVLGRNTVACMQAGIVFGFAGLVDAIVARLEEENGPATVVATGENADLIAPECRRVGHVDPCLTLDGLRLIYERNRG